MDPPVVVASDDDMCVGCLLQTDDTPPQAALLRSGAGRQSILHLHYYILNFHEPGLLDARAVEGAKGLTCKGSH